MKIIAYLIYLYLRFVYVTTRWTKQGHETMQKHSKERTPQIFAFWHSRSAMLPEFGPRHNLTHAIISRSKDGDVMADIMQHYGLNAIRGSSRRAGSKKERGGRHALIESVRALRSGDNLAMSPDGPRGPRQRVSGAIVEIAGHSGALIVPMCYSSTHGIMFNNWDRFFLPLPFGRGWLAAGEPISVPANASAETLANIRLTVEDALNRLLVEVDKKAGRTSPEPA